MSNSFIWPTDRILSGATTPDLIGPGSNGNERVFRIPQSSSVTRASPSDCLVSYSWNSLEWGWGSYPSVAIRSVYSAAPADRAEGLRYSKTNQSTEISYKFKFFSKNTKMSQLIIICTGLIEQIFNITKVQKIIIRPRIKCIVNFQ